MKLMTFLERYYCKNCIAIHNDSMTIAESFNDIAEIFTIFTCLSSPRKLLCLFFCSFIPQRLHRLHPAKLPSFIRARSSDLIWTLPGCKEAIPPPKTTTRLM